MKKILTSAIFCLSMVSICNAQVSSIAKSLGISSIEKAAFDGEKSTYRIVANSKIINNYEINLNEYTFELSEIKSDILIKINKFSNTESIQSLSDIKLKLSNNIITNINTNSVITDADLESNEILHVQVLISIIIFNEIKNPILTENFNNISAKAKACDRTIASIRYTKSSATSHVTSATNAFIAAHPDCTAVNGVDSGCVWGDYCCVATQEIHCTGGGCGVRSGSL